MRKRRWRGKQPKYCSGIREELCCKQIHHGIPVQWQEEKAQCRGVRNEEEKKKKTKKDQ